MNVSITLDDKFYAEILRTLRQVERSDESVLRTGVNNTANIAIKDLASRASQRYTGGAGKRATILSTSSLKKATAANPTAIITFTSPVRDVMEYKARVGKRGITVAVLNTGFKKLDGAFIAGLRWQAKSGQSGTHEAVMRRVKGSVASKYSGRPSKPHYEKIKKVMSPSVAKQVGNEEVLDEQALADLLRDEISKAVDKVLGG